MTIQTKALRYYDRHRVDIEEYPLPEADVGEVIVETRACGICASDVLDWYREPKAPMFFGHEAVGVIRDVGAKVSGFRPGQRVYPHHHVPCMVCPYCARHQHSLCAAFGKSHLDPGGFSQFIRVPADNVRLGMLVLPPDLSFEAATLIEPVACCYRAVTTAHPPPGSSVGVFGAGFNGLVLADLSRRLGAQNVILFDPDPERRDIARRYEIGQVLDPEDNDLPGTVRLRNQRELPETVFVTAPVGRAFEQAFEVVDRGGMVLAYAPADPAATLTIAPFAWYFSQVRFASSYSASPLDTRSVLPWVEEMYQRLSSLSLVRLVDWQDYRLAFQQVRTNRKVLKVILRYGARQ